jgi:hypothetical protein
MFYAELTVSFIILFLIVLVIYRKKEGFDIITESEYPRNKIDAPDSAIDEMTKRKTILEVKNTNNKDRLATAKIAVMNAYETHKKPHEISPYWGINDDNMSNQNRLSTERIHEDQLQSVVAGRNDLVQDFPIKTAQVGFDYAEKMKKRRDAIQYRDNYDMMIQQGYPSDGTKLPIGLTSEVNMQTIPKGMLQVDQLNNSQSREIINLGTNGPHQLDSTLRQTIAI